MTDTPKAPKKSPNPQATEKNTTQTELPRNDDIAARAEENMHMAVTRTGTVPEDIETMVVETRDQLLAEGEQNVYLADRKLDTLTLEQLDHQRTLSRALGVGEEDEDTAALMETAVKRAETMKNKTRDTSRDHKHNSIPSNYRVEPKGDGNIKAVNVITGRVYEGPASGLTKAD